MQTLSSASRTWIASSSAVECTATVAMPSSLQARNTRSAISPRLAMRILSNIENLKAANGALRIANRVRTSTLLAIRCSPFASFDNQKRLAVLDRLAIFDQNLDDRAGARRGNLIHRLHRFDDDQRVTDLHPAADLDK